MRCSESLRTVTVYRVLVGDTKLCVCELLHRNVYSTGNALPFPLENILRVVESKKEQGLLLTHNASLLRHIIVDTLYINQVVWKIDTWTPHSAIAIRSIGLNPLYSPLDCANSCCAYHTAVDQTAEVYIRYCSNHSFPIFTN